MQRLNITPSIRKKLILLFLIPTFLALLQLIFFTNYIKFDNKNFNPQTKEQRLVKAQQTIFNALLSAYRKTPSTEFQKAVAAINDAHPSLENYKLSFSLSNAPKWPLHFCIDNNTPSKSYNHFSGSFSTSCQLAPNLWLNYAAKPIFFIYRFATVILMINLLASAFVILYIISIIRFTIPLKRFRKAADRLGADIDTNPIRKFGPSVIRETTDALNKMQDRIKDLIDARTKMLAAISHDLRTPITRIRLAASLMDDTERADKIIHNLDEMSIMIADVLSFSRDDAKHQPKQKLDLNSLITSIYYDFVDLGHKIHYEPLQERVILFGKTLMLKRAITNIISNAIKYAEQVWIKLKVFEKEILIEILDDGPGIPEEDLTKAFQAFYRSQNSKNKSSTGVGLGLTIAQEVIHNHGGTITLANRQPQGLHVSMRFKRENL